MNMIDILVEHPIDVPELNVKGFVDLVAFYDNGEIHVADIKTVGSWAWKYKYGRIKNGNPSIHQELQLGAYGYAIKEEFGRCDGLSILNYNKDNSDFRRADVDIEFINMAYNFWFNVKDRHTRGLPPLSEGESPVSKWECGYCSYKGVCDAN